MRWLRCCLFGLVLLAIAVPAWGQEKQYELSNFDVTMTLRPDGTIEVDEAIAYDFQRGAFTYAYRSISIEDVGAVRGLRVTSPDVSVDSLRMTSGDDVHRVRWTFPERSEPARFRIHYLLEAALYARGDRNEVNRDVMAPEAVVPTRDVDVRVVLPAAFNLRRNQVTLEPAEGGTVRRDAGQIVAHLHRDRVEEGEGLPVAVTFPKRVAGEYLPTGGQVALGVLLLLLGIGAGAAANRSWRGPRPDVTAQRPPEDVPLPAAAALLKNRVQQAVPAMMFDLAQRGHLTLKHDREEGPFGSSEIVRLDVHPDRFQLSDAEAKLVERLGDYDTLDAFWSDTSSFRTALVQSARDRLVDRGWMDRHTMRSNVLIVAAVAALLAAGAGVFLLEGRAALVALFAGVGASIGGFVAGARRRTWTEDGARRAMALRAFLDHEKAEIDRLRASDPVRAAERLVESLPWLMLHGDVSSSWIEETTEALEAADGVPAVPDGFVSLVAQREAANAATAAFLPVVGVMNATESSGVGAAGATGAAGTGGAAGGGAAGAG
jgi:uncharacterized protein (TIGR04222 family)